MMIIKLSNQHFPLPVRIHTLMKFENTSSIYLRLHNNLHLMNSVCPRFKYR